MRLFSAAFVVAGLALSACNRSEPATSTEQIMVVLDASLAMSEMTEGFSKLELMRDRFGMMLANWQDQEVEVGLVIFGHQNQNDCADIELIDTPRSVDPVTLGRIAYKLSPKGQAPLSEAVYVAAKYLPASERPSTIVAITNGQDTCGFDPCLLTAELEKMGITLDVYNVSDGSANLHCGITDVETSENPSTDDYSTVEQSVTIQALRHDTGEPMSPMTWVLYGPEDNTYELSATNPTLDLSRMAATELRAGEYTITGFSGDYAGSSHFSLGENTPDQDVIYVILYADVLHPSEQ